MNGEDDRQITIRVEIMPSFNNIKTQVQVQVQVHVASDASTKVVQ
jgi:hypothetical protein